MIYLKTKKLLFTAQEPLIATIRVGILKFAAQKPPHSWIMFLRNTQPVRIPDP